MNLLQAQFARIRHGPQKPLTPQINARGIYAGRTGADSWILEPGELVRERQP